MARSGVVALSVAIFLAFFEIGSCVRCYQCNSQSDKTCGDPFSPGTKMPVDCSQIGSTEYNTNYLSNILPSKLLVGTVGAPRYCHKIVMQTGTVVRTCLDTSPVDMNETCKVVGSFAKHCSVCNKDLCNGASGIAFSLPLGLLALFGSYLLYAQ